MWELLNWLMNDSAESRTIRRQKKLFRLNSGGMHYVSPPARERKYVIYSLCFLFTCTLSSFGLLTLNPREISLTHRKQFFAFLSSQCCHFWTKVHHELSEQPKNFFAGICDMDFSLELMGVEWIIEQNTSVCGLILAELCREKKERSLIISHPCHKTSSVSSYLSDFIYDFICEITSLCGWSLVRTCFSFFYLASWKLKRY